MNEWRVLDLFSGIGGFSLGLKRAGMRTVAFCEIDQYCAAVLRKHWPTIPIHNDITTREFTQGEADVVCAGFPCQDVSLAGFRAGLAGSRSGLWRELVRAIRVVRPFYALVENVAALLGNGMGVVLSDLAALRYDAEWDCICASDLGAPHERDRVWIVAYTNGSGVPGLVTGVYSCPSGQGWKGSAQAVLASDPFMPGHCWPQPLLRRMDDGVANRVDRVRAAGNAVVPQIPQIIGEAIIKAHR